MDNDWGHLSGTMRAFLKFFAWPERGAISEASRSLGIDRQIISNWMNKGNGGIIKTNYATRVEEVTGGHVRAIDVLRDADQWRKKRLEERRLRLMKKRA